MKNVFLDDVDAKRIFREVYILRRVRHPSIVRLIDVISTNSQSPVSSGAELCLVFDYVDTDLLKILRSNQYLSHEHLQYILFQLFEATAYLHKHHIIHRDIKPANILVSCTDSSIKLADFGLARVLDDGAPTLPESSIDKGMGSPMFANSTDGDSTDGEYVHIPLTRKLTKHVVTRWYRAPEIVLMQQYGEAVDIWSIGCVLADLQNLIKDNVADFCARKPLFPGER